MKKISIIGGGPAGMMAAYAASQNGKSDITIYEKNEKLGRKLLITGKGRCNVTNMGDIDDYINCIPRNAAFLYSAFAAFDNQDLISLFNEGGLKTKIERGARVFPVSDKSSDVVGFFSELLKKRGIEVAKKKNVAKIEYSKNEKNFLIYFRDSSYAASDAVIIATGGLSYPLTGSTGEGYIIASSLGHTITERYPSLVAIVTKEDLKNLSGLTLKNVAIKILDIKNKTVFEDFGELLFTHSGVSGPVILSASSIITERLTNEDLKLYIDLKPALDKKMLDTRLLKDFNKYKNKDLINALNDLLPKSLIPVVVERCGISPNKKVNEISKTERKSLINIIKELQFILTETEGFENAVITRGGVKVSEINPKTMESKIVKGLFFAGEIIDVDAYTGGYNLQIAFSTGYLAGVNASG